ncbi:MAG TPA: peroxidase family protein [Nitrospira sp.]|nr:peroxidase family protein [Nitrospira sp.]
MDLEFQRMEMIKFNLLDNSGTYEKYTETWRDPAGVFHTPWAEMRVLDEKPAGNDMDDQEYARAMARLKHDGLTTDPVDGSQQCKGETIRFRDLNGYCNDIVNPLMGSTNQPLARNVQFEAVTFTDLDDQKQSLETRNRHGHRLSLLQPNPQVISRTLFSRDQSQSVNCHEGHGSNSESSRCAYEKANSFNVLAAFWIQFMTHDWFSHTKEGRNADTMMHMACTEELKQTIHCRPEDEIGEALIDRTDPGTFNNGKSLKKAQRRTLNRVTAWWDASQVYGYDETSRKRVKRDPKNPAKLFMQPLGPEPHDDRGRASWKQGYLPVLDASDKDHVNPLWEGQEATAFPANWSIGLSFFHNVFAREHNKFVDYFRSQDPKEDSGVRRPDRPEDVVQFGEVTPDELFEIARLVVSAEIAKIHTIEWTTQLLYDEALYRGMNANWFGLTTKYHAVSAAIETVMDRMKDSGDVANANLKYSAFAGGPGIFGMRNEIWDCRLIFFCSNTWTFPNPDDINGGTHHFGSPFNFPEEFITVYRLHPMLPDLIEYRKYDRPDHIQQTIPVVETFRKKATAVMHNTGLANLAISMGRQRLGRLTLLNHPQFLQNLPIDDVGHQIDVAALDLIRDRERGIPRFNEFRRQYGLRTLSSFDDFIDETLVEAAKKDPTKQKELDRQIDIVKRLRAVYGRHTCDQSKVITTAQKTQIETPEGVRWEPINDCLGHPNGSEVDNIEDVDTVVGWLAEPVRPHGFAISETQFQVFILNASRRLFSDRFFTSSFTKEFYSKVGVEWVMNNGPEDQCVEQTWLLFHQVDSSPLKCVLRRTIPELEPELAHVVNAFDPWARDRGNYYDLQWKPREDAKADEAFRPSVIR